MAFTECQKDLLVIYENSAEDWAIYMRELLEPSLNANGISLCNLDSETDEMLESLYLCGYRCKLLLLTNVLLENLKERQSSNFCQLLQPSSNLVILPCGLETLDGFYELVPIDRDLQVLFTDQDPQDYVSVVLCIVHEDYEDYRDSDINCLQNSPMKDEDFESRETTEKTNSKMPSAFVLPQKIPCENPGEIVIVLTEEIPTTSKVEIEFCRENQLIRRQATRWNGKVMSLKALEFPAGSVTVNVCCDDVIRASTEIKYYTLTGELEVLLRKVVDPIAFICQAFNVYSIEDLDMVLMKSLQIKMSSLEFNLHEINQCTNANFEEIPTLLHCAAKFGLKEVTLLLMECPGADRILNITNKYGEDPATIADRHGHGEIKEIIHQLAQKVNANKFDPQEGSEFEQEDVYVGMDVHSAQHSGDESGDNTIQESHENQNSVPGVSAHSQLMLDYKEEDNYDEELNVNDDYCFSFSGGCDSAAFGDENSILQDQQDCQGKDDQLYLDDNDYEEKANDNKDELHLPHFELAGENIYTSMQQENVSEEDIIMYNESFAVTISSSESTSQTFNEATNEENILNLNKEKSDNFFSNDHLPFGELEYKCDMNESENKDGEEPYIVTSTDDSLYITFQVSEKQREQQRTFSPYSPLPPEPSFNETEEEEEEDGNDHDNVSHSAQGEEKEYNEHVSWSEQECEHKEEGSWDEEEQYIVATDDSLYIIFEAASKETQREQQSFKWADPIPDKPPLHVAEDNPSFIDEEKEEGNNKEYAFNEHVCEGGNVKEDEEEPCITATTDDDLYIVFEPMKKEPQSGQQCFSQHTNQPPDLSLHSAEECSSHFAQARQTKESTNPNIWLDERIDEMEYIYYEEDPYSLVYSDDDSLYIELPMESTEEPKREKKSFIIHRAPAPAPRVDVPAPENEPSYISQVFKQKQEEKKIYGTGMPQGLQLKDEDKNVYSFPPRFQPREQEKKMYATVPPKHKDKQQANYEGPVISQQCVPSGQEELILLQEKVKLGVMSMDEALEKFQQWQNEKSELDRLQKEKLQQLRDSIIGDKTEDDRLYDKITIVHQPNVSDAHMKRGHGAFDNSIYQTPFTPSTPYAAAKKDIYAPSKHHTK
ncbi:B-cell scaffold protein with ankyrin repeats [Xenopus laevis]|uniref:B-cell scaffold protein with ankyrin repeats n=2 Tax=Xenopus laevis TaxID=8355 RepID=A0A1L8HV07_XENLA|nr:B-cell scaffold protein with ankyrin repeats [Xenopus laevis]OCT99939.1 hypothetical protein XELAEV_18005724mg [Xenopus laevis]